jgi:MYXO-CTERM domain-containing protein
VTLDGTGSSDPNHQPLQFTWEQDQGPRVELQRSDPARPRFVVPTIEDAANRTLSFRLTVSDGVFTASDTVTVEAQPRPVVDPPDPPGPPAPVAGGSGCGCSAAGHAPSLSWLFWLLGTLTLLRAARRPVGGR